MHVATHEQTYALYGAARSMDRSGNVIQSNAKVDRNKKDDDLGIVGPSNFNIDLYGRINTYTPTPSLPLSSIP